VSITLANGSVLDMHEDQLLPCASPSEGNNDQGQQAASEQQPKKPLEAAPHGLQSVEVLRRAGDLQPERDTLSVLRLQKVPVEKIQRGHLQTVPRDRICVDVEHPNRHMVFAGGGVPGTHIALSSAGMRDDKPRSVSCPAVFRENAQQQKQREILEASKNDPDLMPSMEITHARIDEQLGKTMYAGRCTAGFWPTKRAIAGGSAEHFVVMIAADCPPPARGEIEEVAREAKVGVFAYPDTSVNLGKALGQNLRVPCTAVTSAEDSEVFQPLLERVADILEERRLEEELRRTRALMATKRYQLNEQIHDSRREAADLEVRIKEMQRSLEEARSRTVRMEEELANLPPEESEPVPAGSGAKAVLAKKKADAAESAPETNESAQ